MQQKQLAVHTPKRINRSLKWTVNRSPSPTKANARQSNSAPKSFRSKIFERRILKQTPVVGSKQITMHQPLSAERYLNTDFKMPEFEKVPQMWGCIVPKDRRRFSKTNSVPLSARTNTPQNLFRNYMSRKSRMGHRSILSSHTDFRKNPESANDFSKDLQLTKRYHEVDRGRLEELASKQKESDSIEQKEHQAHTMTNTFITDQQLEPLSSCRFKAEIERLRRSIEWKRRLLQDLNSSIQSSQRRY